MAFNRQRFLFALNLRRRWAGLLWQDVAEQAGVSPSTLTRLAQGRAPSIDVFAALCRWGQLDANDFIQPNTTETP